MAAACMRLPMRLADAAGLDWSEALEPLTRAGSTIVIGRGPTLAIAREAALKLKETCELPAEAFSAAEFRHGPIALVSSTYPVLALAPTDESPQGFRRLPMICAARAPACLSQSRAAHNLVACLYSRLITRTRTRSVSFRAFTHFWCISRRDVARTSTGRATCKKSRAPDERSYARYRLPPCLRR